MEVDWDKWEPSMRATLLFVIKDGQVLLIRKKRGIGAGKINGPGGKIDPGETAIESAIREVQEELVVTPTGLKEMGDLSFQFVDGLALHVVVYTATGLEGTPRETEEAIPLWTPVDQIPYQEMWEDDIYWLPRMLQGETFSGKFTFDDDVMLSKEVEFPGG